ncbi:hypothetical protein, partial [Burkholderia pseudomallei]|uniref:hypothetical protein n=1 Tax=Burkholderia pseudomallei TaxID=28450 RepID=UPI0016541EA9
ALHPARVAASCGEAALTYGELDRASERRRTTRGARAPARRVANRRIDGMRRALGARERRASQHVVLARVRRGPRTASLRIAPYRSVSLRIAS